MHTHIFYCEKKTLNWFTISLKNTFVVVCENGYFLQGYEYTCGSHCERQTFLQYISYAWYAYACICLYEALASIASLIGICMRHMDRNSVLKLCWTLIGSLIEAGAVCWYDLSLVYLSCRQGVRSKRFIRALVSHWHPPTLSRSSISIALRCHLPTTIYIY